jgi:hypothetical protein
LTSYETYESITASNLEISGATIPENTVVYRKINITPTIPAYSFHTSVQSLVSSYIPPAVFSELAISVAAAASSAAVTGDATSLIYAALEGDQVDNAYMTGFKPELHAEPVQLPQPVHEMDASPNLLELAVHEKPQQLNADHASRNT